MATNAVDESGIPYVVLIGLPPVKTRADATVIVIAL